MKIGVLTSGGDAPGMNAAIRAVVKAANYHNIEVMGIRRGYQGLIDEDIHPLTSFEVEDIADKGGTILKTARCMDFMEEPGRLRGVETLKKFGIDAVVVIGGDGSFAGAKHLSRLGFPTIGIPGTIDNDLAYTDYTLGFDTTLNTVLDSISKIKDTDSSHEKTSIVEVMGRYCGDLALYSALAGGGEIISTPEKRLDAEGICERLKARIDSGRPDNMIIITERMYYLPDLQRYIEEKLKISVRTTVLGFIQRGGHPSAFDRVLASRMGVAAVDLLIKGKSALAVGVRKNEIISVDIENVNSEAMNKEESYNMLEILQG